VSNRPESTNSNANSDSATLTERAAAAARAELRGERDSILGAIGIAARRRSLAPATCRTVGRFCL
jgi:hypothetical protein